MRGHCYDALVGLAGCDKSLPGMMMAMVRLNVPSVFIYGGSILPGRLDGKDVTVQDVFEAVGQHQAGNMSDEELRALERVACPVGRRLRRPVHRQHHGLRVRGDRPCAAEFLGRAGALRKPRRLWRGLGRGGDEPARKEHPRRATSSRASRWKTPRASWPAPADRPMPVCTCPPSPTRPGSISTWTTSARSSATRPISSI